MMDDDGDPMLKPDPAHEAWIEKTISKRTRKKTMNPDPEGGIKAPRRQYMKSIEDRWVEIAWHPDGFVLSASWSLKEPWVTLRLAHPDWAERPKKDRYVWLVWNADTRQLKSASCSRVTQDFAQELPDICKWMFQFLAEIRGGKPE